MKLIQMKCPACGSTIDVPSDRIKVYCVYCGTSIFIDDEVERKEITYRKIDEAEIVKSNNEVRLKEMEYQEKEREEKRALKDDINFLLPFIFMICALIVFGFIIKILF